VVFGGALVAWGLAEATARLVWRRDGIAKNSDTTN
jgi:hypothetical protein